MCADTSAELRQCHLVSSPCSPGGGQRAGHTGCRGERGWEQHARETAASCREGDRPGVVWDPECGASLTFIPPPTSCETELSAQKQQRCVITTFFFSFQKSHFSVWRGRPEGGGSPGGLPTACLDRLLPSRSGPGPPPQPVYSDCHVACCCALSRLQK